MLPRARCRALVLALVAGCATTTAAPPSTTPPAATTRSPWDLTGTTLVDLSHTYDETTLYWPTSPSTFELQSLSHGVTAGGFFYSANVIATPEHGGTHLDSPIHFAAQGSTTEQIPLTRLVAPAVVVDMRARANEDRDALLAVADLEAFEAEHGAIEPGTIVLVHTGFGERWPDAKAYLGDDTRGDATGLHFPGISKEAAQALVDRKIAAVGIDTASIDHGPSRDFIAHQILLGADVPAFENVTGLRELPPRGALVMALPMKIGGGSGGPLRIIAAVPSP